jgi:hypothetical protein
VTERAPETKAFLIFGAISLYLSYPGIEGNLSCPSRHPEVGTDRARSGNSRELRVRVRMFMISNATSGSSPKRMDREG